MTDTKAFIRTISGMQSAVGWGGDQVITIGRPEEVGGESLGAGGRQMLVLTVGT